MSTVEEGQAIEGEKLEGHSRHPLRTMGLTIENGVQCEKYIVEHNVRAQATQQATPPPLFVPGAILDPTQEVICEMAVIFTLDKKPSTKVAKGSHTHKASHWAFSKRTAVLVQRAHEAIRQAIATRNAEQRNLLPVR